eukprot:scaffold42830_cov176-Amphora_coffeaeformis.AAC.3
MPDPRVQEGSISDSAEQEKEQQHELHDLPSTLHYKDQGRDFRVVVEGVSDPTRVAGAVTRPQQHHDLPSHLDYKDQGRDYRDVVAVQSTQARGSGETIHELPSNLEYKDLGRDMSSILPNNVAPAVAGHRRQELPSNINYKDQGRDFGSIILQSVTKPAVPPGTHDPPSTGRASETPSPPSLPSKGGPTDSPRDRRRRYVYIGGAVAVILLTIVVGVVVAIPGDSSDKAEAINRTEETTAPSIGPLLSTSAPNTLTPTVVPTLAPTQFRLWKSATEPILGETPNEYLGFSVDFSGDANILAAGAYRHDVTDGLDGFDGGQVRIFRRNGDNWDTIGRINGSSPNEQYGWAVALSKDGTILAHGTPQTPLENGDRSGSVNVYRFSEPNVWTPIGNTLGNATSFSDLGFAIDLNEDGTICALSYNGDDALGLLNIGSFEVYQYDSLSEDWVLMGDKVYGEESFDFFGYALRMNYEGSIVASGAGSQNRPSYVKVYSFNDVQQSWDIMGNTIRATLQDDDFDRNYFGGALALSADGLTVVIGAPSIARGAGFAEVFRFNESANQWDPLGQTIRGQTEGELFGYSVDISADGSVVMIGASNYAGPAVRMGRVAFYEFNGTYWNQLGNSIVGESVSGNLGFAVSISPDATSGVIGVYQDNTAGLAAGKLVIVERDL